MKTRMMPLAPTSKKILTTLAEHHMTLATYLQKNSAFSIMVIGIAMAAAFYVGSSRLPAKHDANFSFTVDHRELQTPDAYAYDGYYALRATEIFTDTVVSWFKTPSIIKEIREDAIVNYGKMLPDELNFRVKKFSGQNILISISDSDPARAHALSTSAIAVVTTHVEGLNKSDDGKSLFVLNASEPLITQKHFPPARAGLIGLALGLVGGAILVFLITPPKSGVLRIFQ